MGTSENTKGVNPHPPQLDLPAPAHIRLTPKRPAPGDPAEDGQDERETVQ